MKASEDAPADLATPSSKPYSGQEEREKLPEHKILIELIEDLDEKQDEMRKVEAIEDILQTDAESRQAKIQLWADRLEKHPRTIKRWPEKVDKESLASIARATRADAGRLKGCKQWKHDVDYWVKFITNTYIQGKQVSLGMTPNLVNGQVKGHAEVEMCPLKN